MSITSSVSLRPSGNPALSPPMTPRSEHDDEQGGIDMFSRSSSDGTTLPGGLFSPWNPVASDNRSLRGVGGAWTP